MSGGQPTERQPDGGCTTKEGGVNGSGFWFFTRAQVASPATLATLAGTAKARGFSLAKLHDVAQKGCDYSKTFIKK